MKSSNEILGTSIYKVLEILGEVKLIISKQGLMQIIRNSDGQELSPQLPVKELSQFCEDNLERYRDFSRGVFIGLLPKGDDTMLMPFWK